ncbi:MAG: ATP-binding protein, partial [Candidatus Binatia bacterium]
MSASSTSDFVGRDHELSRLEAGLEESMHGTGRLFLIRGEAGIGKTRLADEIGKRAAARGAIVLRGRCWEEGDAPAFWPWIEVFRDLLGRKASASFSSPEVVGLAQLVPEAATGPLLSLEGRQNHFALLESAALALKRASATGPLVLLFEDLHAADHSSLLMLRFLAGEVWASRILVVGTRRDHAAKAPSAELLDEIGRGAEVLKLGPLSEAQSEQIIRRLVTRVPRRLLAEIYRVTEGNPLFIHEVARLAASEWETTGSFVRVGVPKQLRDAIRRRIESLSPDVLEMLSLASVIGRDFDLASLTIASGLSTERALPLLGEAAASGIVDSEPGIGRYRFSHALIWETLHEDLPQARRAELHDRIAVALESIRGVSPVAEVSKLAQHYLEVARAGGDRRKAVEYATCAAEHALRSFAYQEAGDHYERALGLLEESGAAEDRSRCELRLALGEARSKAGDAPEARASFLAAADSARRLASRTKDAASLLARAALGLGGVWLVTGIGVVDEVLRDLLEEALAALPEEDSALRARVLARLAAELGWSDAGDRREGLSRSAVEMARRLGDASTLAYALIGRYWALWGPDNVEERLAIATEVVGLGAAAADDCVALAGHT